MVRSVSTNYFSKVQIFKDGVYGEEKRRKWGLESNFAMYSSDEDGEGRDYELL